MGNERAQGVFLRQNQREWANIGKIGQNWYTSLAKDTLTSSLYTLYRIW
jgi:hypothetical protein